MITETEILAESATLMRAAQAAMKEAGEEIIRLRAVAARKNLALSRALEKLKLYRAERDGKYPGGMEYTALVKFIEEAHAL